LNHSCAAQATDDPLLADHAHRASVGHAVAAALLAICAGESIDPEAVGDDDERSLWLDDVATHDGPRLLLELLLARDAKDGGDDAFELLRRLAQVHKHQAAVVERIVRRVGGGVFSAHAAGMALYQMMDGSSSKKGELAILTALEAIRERAKQCRHSGKDPARAYDKHQAAAPGASGPRRDRRGPGDGPGGAPAADAEAEADRAAAELLAEEQAAEDRKAAKSSKKKNKKKKGKAPPPAEAAAAEPAAEARGPLEASDDDDSDDDDAMLLNLVGRGGADREGKRENGAAARAPPRDGRGAPPPRNGRRKGDRGRERSDSAFDDEPGGAPRMVLDDFGRPIGYGGVRAAAPAPAPAPAPPPAPSPARAKKADRAPARAPEKAPAKEPRKPTKAERKAANRERDRVAKEAKDERDRQAAAARAARQAAAPPAAPPPPRAPAAAPIARPRARAPPPAPPPPPADDAGDDDDDDLLRSAMEFSLDDMADEPPPAPAPPAPRRGDPRVAALLRRRGLGAYGPALAAHEVDVDALRLMAPGDFADVGVPRGAGEAILDALREDDAGGAPWAEGWY